MATDELTVKVWRLHPDGCRVVPAERTLNKTAPKAAVRWCGPFTNANKAGWWLYSPVDIDIVWRGRKEFEHELLSPYTNADELLVRFLLRDVEGVTPERWLSPGGRTKFTWGIVEEGVVQIWTGCIFETPPDWGLYLRSPVNGPVQPYHVMEAILETDWLQYDIWFNVVFDRPNETARLRRDGWPPLAQIIPVPRATYDARWKLEEETVNRNTPDANRVFEYYVAYNEKKYGGVTVDAAETRDLLDDAKDSATYHKERKRLLSRTDVEPTRGGATKGQTL